MLSNFAEKKETFFDLKKQHFSKSKKSHFLKGINPCFWPKKCHFLLYLDLIKKRLEIMLNYFEEKRNLFDYTKQNVSGSKKSHLFSKGLTNAFGQNMPIFLFKFDQNKPRNNAF